MVKPSDDEPADSTHSTRLIRLAFARITTMQTSSQPPSLLH